MPIVLNKNLNIGMGLVNGMVWNGVAVVVDEGMKGEIQRNRGELEQRLTCFDYKWQTQNTE